MTDHEMGKHQDVIDSLLNYINDVPGSPFILKGGMALAECYGLDRFSENVDLDAIPERRRTFLDTISGFCEENGFSFRIGKDTQTVQRAFINYGEEGRPLKAEASYRRTSFAEGSVCTVNGIQTYSINELAEQKAASYLSRDKIRDLYDVSFICTKYGSSLSDGALNSIRNALEYKDLDQFDYLVKTQDDPLVDVERMEEMFLESFEKAGLLVPERTDFGNTDKNAKEKDADYVGVSYDGANALYGKTAADDGGYDDYDDCDPVD